MRTFFVGLAGLIIVVFALALVSCGKGNGALQSPFQSLGAGSGGEGAGFSVEPFGKGDPNPSQEGRLVANVLETNAAGRLEVAIDVEGAKDFKSALLHLHYDSSRYSPVLVRQGDFLPNAIFMGVTRLPGIVPIASVLPDPLEREGVTGDGRIATVEFELRPFSGARSVSVVPSNIQNKILAASVIDDPVNKEASLVFTEKNVGDYDLDTEVSVSDITPIALRYQQTVGTGNPANDPVAVIDGDASGDVGIPDITPIALNYLNKVTGYGVRWGIDDGAGNVADMGMLPNLLTPANPTSIDRIYFGNGLRPRYTYIHNYGAEPAYTYADGANLRYWISPFADGAFGIEGGPFSTAGGNPGGDVTPPAWLSGFGIISAQYNLDNTAVDIVFGEAEDTESAPVRYYVYWQAGDVLNYADAVANGRFFPVDVQGQPTSPYTHQVTAADGVTFGADLSFAVHARDSALPPNETPTYNPHPIHPGGTDWLVAQPGTPAQDVPPTWLVTIGITEAKPGNTSVNVGWGLAYHSEGAPSYEVYWAEGDKTLTPLEVFSSLTHANVTGATQYTVPGLTNGTLYSFGVRAVSPRGTEDANTVVLTATPQESIFPFKVPPDGVSDCGLVSSDSDIALTPIDNAPAIVFTNDVSNLLGVAYFDGLTWIQEPIASGARFDHPSIDIIGNTIVVSGYNRTTMAIELYTGDKNAQNWVMETVDSEGIPGEGFTQCWSASMDYYPGTDTLGLVYMAGIGSVYFSDSKSILKYAFRTGGGAWTLETIQDTQGTLYNCPGECFVFQADGTPSVAYDYGHFDPLPTGPIYDSYVYYGERTGGVWTTEEVPGPWKANQPIFLTYNTVTHQPFIAMGRDREIPIMTMSVPVTDAVVAWKDSDSNWQDQVISQGDANLDQGTFILTADFEGVDPVIGFDLSGQGYFYWSYVHATDDALNGIVVVDSYLTVSTFNGVTWSAPDQLQFDPALGCSATNMAIDVSKARLSYQEIGELDYAPNFNDFPAGYLEYEQF